jgi:hypothetical protein
VTESYTIEVASKKKNYWSTGMYLLPGKEMTIKILSRDNMDYKKFSVCIIVQKYILKLRALFKVTNPSKGKYGLVSMPHALKPP